MSELFAEGTPERIVLEALQRIAFDDSGDPRDIALEALHESGFATMHVFYRGPFHLSWLAPGERVRSAGDGTGAAIIVRADGSERRINIGDHIGERSA